MPDDPDAHGPEAPTAVPTIRDGQVEAYQTDEGIVLYDAGNPLAWIESHDPVLLDEVN